MLGDLIMLNSVRQGGSDTRLRLWMGRDEFGYERVMYVHNGVLNWAVESERYYTLLSSITDADEDAI